MARWHRAPGRALPAEPQVTSKNPPHSSTTSPQVGLFAHFTRTGIPGRDRPPAGAGTRLVRASGPDQLAGVEGAVAAAADDGDVAGGRRLPEESAAIDHQHLAGDVVAALEQVQQSGHGVLRRAQPGERRGPGQPLALGGVVLLRAPARRPARSRSPSRRARARGPAPWSASPRPPC